MCILPDCHLCWSFISLLVGLHNVTSYTEVSFYVSITVIVVDQVAYWLSEYSLGVLPICPCLVVLLNSIREPATVRLIVYYILVMMAGIDNYVNFRPKKLFISICSQGLPFWLLALSLIFFPSIF